MLDNEHGVEQIASVPSLGVQEGKAIHGVVNLQSKYLRSTTCYFILFIYFVVKQDSLRSHSSEPLWWSKI